MNAPRTMKITTGTLITIIAAAFSGAGGFLISEARTSGQYMKQVDINTGIIQEEKVKLQVEQKGLQDLTLQFTTLSGTLQEWKNETGNLSRAVEKLNDKIDALRLMEIQKLRNSTDKQRKGLQ